MCLGHVEVAVEPEFDDGAELGLVAAGAHAAIPALPRQGLVFVLPPPDLGWHAGVASKREVTFLDDPWGVLE